MLSFSVLRCGYCRNQMFRKLYAIPCCLLLLINELVLISSLGMSLGIFFQILFPENIQEICHASEKGATGKSNSLEFAPIK